MTTVDEMIVLVIMDCENRTSSSLNKEVLYRLEIFLNKTSSIT